MKFYQVTDDDGATLGCETSLRAAIKLAEGYGAQSYAVTLITVGVPPREAIRRLLGDVGGYAAESTEVYRVEDGVAAEVRNG